MEASPTQPPQQPPASEPQKPADPAIERDIFAGFPKGAEQLRRVCARGNEDQVSKRLCATPTPQIQSLVDLQRALGLDFKPGVTTTGGANPRYTLSGHSSSLVVRHTNAINPRAIIFTEETGQKNPAFIAMGFVRGEQFVELVARDPVKDDLSFFLVRFEQACNAKSCSNYDLLTPAIEKNWTGWTLYQDVDIKNTVMDCLHCHQPQGPGTKKMLRMQELRDPWTHFFRNGEASSVLRDDYLAAHGAEETYAGIPGAMIASTSNDSSSNPERLEDVVRDEGFGEQPNEFPTNPTEANWMPRYLAGVNGTVIPAPSFRIRITDPAKLAAATKNYRDVMTGVLPPSALMDIRDIVDPTALPEMSLRPRPGLDGRGMLVHMCQRCHNPALDQTISRARFDVTKLDTMPRAEKDLAIQRLMLPEGHKLKMPPERFGMLSPDEIQLAVQELSK